MSENPLSSLGERIAWARSLANMSTKELDALSELTTPTVHRVEHDNRMPGADSVLRIARVLGTSVDWLIDGSGESPTPESVGGAVARARAAARARALKPTGTDDS